jgi:hypothetical protein
MFIYCVLEEITGYLYKLSIFDNLLAGFMRLVLFVLRACLIFVSWRVFFIRCAWAMSGAAEQSLTEGTVRFFLGPDSQRQRRLTFPVLGFLRNTILCSVTNSWALIRTFLKRFLDPVPLFLDRFQHGL